MEWGPWERVPLEFELTNTVYEKKYRETGGGVARISLNKPEENNALTVRTIQEIGLAVRDADRDFNIAVTIIGTTSDDVFSGGSTEVRYAEKFDRLLGQPREALRHLRHSRHPLVAAIRGECIGDGHDLACVCDYALAADNAVFGQNQAKLGILVDGWTPNYLVRLVGAKKAREMWMLCRTYSAQEALEMGLVNKVVPLSKLDRAVDEWCDILMSVVPAALQVMKFNYDLDVDYQIARTGKLTGSLLADYYQSDEYKEAQQALREGREPNYWRLRKSTLVPSGRRE